MHMGKPSEKKHTHRYSTGSVFFIFFYFFYFCFFLTKEYIHAIPHRQVPSGEGLRVLTAAVYRGRLPGVSCPAACTTFAKPPEQRHSGDGPNPYCRRPNCRTPRLYHIEGCVSVCHRLPSARQRHRWYHRRRGRAPGGSERAAPTASEAFSSIWLPRPWPGGRVITSIRATYIVLQASDHACRILSLLQYRRKCIVSSFPLSRSST